jgi:tyrosine-protein kinase Etk/Wzc
MAARPAPPPDRWRPMIEKLTFSDYVRVVARARYAIGALVVLAAIVAFVYGSRQPKIYSATSTILVPRDDRAASSGMAGALGALLGSGGKDGGLSFPGVQVAMPGAGSNVDMFYTLIMSRSMREEVISEFSKQRGPQIAELFRGVNAAFTKDRTTLSVTVEAREAKLAADMANGYFDFLDRRLQRTAEHQARRQEVFFRAQLERAAREVDVAEDAVVKFQKENRMVGNIGEGVKSGAEAGGSLRGAIMGLELQREVLRMRYTEQHPQMREIDKQIAELKKQYSKNLFGQAMDLPPESPGAKGQRKEYFVSTERMTPTQFAYLKLLRNLKIQEAFYTGALQGLENMRYATEAGKPHGLEMLDPALVPAQPVSPNIKFMVFAAIVAALVMGIAGTLVRQFIILTWVPERRREEPAPTVRRRVSNGKPPIGAPVPVATPPNPEVVV